jgi:hypothetical protein
LLKNLHSRKAVVTIFIDGKDVLDGNSLVIEANETGQLDGVMKRNKVKNRFKFIKKTQEIADHRGDRIDDGIIRIEVKFEAEREELPITSWTWPSMQFDGWTIGSDIKYRNDTYFSNSSSGEMNGLVSNCSYTVDNSLSSAPAEEEGITVKGSETDQDFSRGYVDTLETQSTVITIRLIGVTEDRVKIKKSIYVKTKVECETCGKFWKSNVNFCPNCGTKL